MTQTPPKLSNSSSGIWHGIRLGGLSESKKMIVKKLNKRQISEYQEAFKMFDKDNDGIITPNELRQALKDMGARSHHLEGADPTAEEIADIVNEFDIDGDGKIDFREFLIMMAKQHGTNDDYRAAFDAIDTNKDGYISVEDLMKMFANIGMSLSEEQIKHLIEAGDRNGNGAIDYEEFVAMMKSSQKSR